MGGGYPIPLTHITLSIPHQGHTNSSPLPASNFLTDAINHNHT